MLARLFSPLLFLLGIVGISNAQYGNCDYLQVMDPGKVYPVYSPGYVSGFNYPPGTFCRWTARSNQPIHMTCDTFIVPQKSQCTIDVVTVQTSPGSGHKYCGDGKLNLISEANEIVIMLESSIYSPSGGRFFCTLQTIDETNNDCNCGWKNPARIVGGKETGINEYPMMAGIFDVRKGIVACGATIINNRQVLTAAHCTNGFNQQNPMEVLVGEHDTSRNDETTATRRFRVLGWVVNANYSTITKNNDVAIVTVDGVIQFSQQVGPACLPFQHAQDSFAGNYVDILGWGSTAFAALQSNVLQKAEVAVITARTCLRNWSVTSRQMCILEPGKDACQFDSGGPVLWKNPSTKRIVLVGIISYGGTCADGVPGVNARIGAFMNWIQANSPRGFEYCVEE